MQTDTENKIQNAYDYLKNHQNLKEFDFKIDKSNIEITDKRTLEPYYEDTYRNMIYLTFDVQDETNLKQLVEYIKFMADYLLQFD